MNAQIALAQLPSGIARLTQQPAQHLAVVEVFNDSLNGQPVAHLLVFGLVGGKAAALTGASTRYPIGSDQMPEAVRKHLPARLASPSDPLLCLNGKPVSHLAITRRILKQMRSASI